MGDENDSLTEVLEDEDPLVEARGILLEALDTIAEAAYVIGAPLGLLPRDEEGDIAFDHEDLRATSHPTLKAIADIAEAVYAALETLPPEDDEDDDDDDDDDDDA